ncbi:hypothetical protein NIES22_38000 [Calothrix brevissima NIES-22]|nr:hypothetical protein NIES22_38000 [Calothrix brevissima NIES-22]
MYLVYSLNLSARNTAGFMDRELERKHQIAQFLSNFTYANPIFVKAYSPHTQADLKVTRDKWQMGNFLDISADNDVIEAEFLNFLDTSIFLYQLLQIQAQEFRGIIQIKNELINEQAARISELECLLNPYSPDGDAICNSD